MFAKVAVLLCLIGLTLAGNLYGGYSGYSLGHGYSHGSLGHGSLGYSSFSVPAVYSAPLYKSYTAPLYKSYSAPIYKSYVAPISYSAPIYKRYSAPISYSSYYPVSYGYSSHGYGYGSKYGW